MEGRDTVIYKLSRLLVPVCQLDEEGRHAIAGEARVVRLAPEDRIAAADDEEWLTYVVKGELAIRSAVDGVLEVIPGGSGRARRPLFNTYPKGLHAEARTSSILLRFDRSLFRCLLSEQREPRKGARPLTAQQLFARVYGAWFEDSLPLPAAPASTLHLLHGAGAPASLHQLALTLRSAPELERDFIRATNHLRGLRPPATSAAEAVMRVGLAGGNLLGITLALRPMFLLQEPRAQRLATRQFEHGVLIGALASLLARRHGGLDPYRAFVTGAVHDLGALTVALYLDHRPDVLTGDEACALASRRLRAVVGPPLLTRLGFDLAMAEASEQAEHWHRNAPSPGEADLLIAAHLIAALEDPAPAVPSVAQVPAIGRLWPGASRREMLDLLRHAFRLCASLRRRFE